MSLNQPPNYPPPPPTASPYPAPAPRRRRSRWRQVRMACLGCGLSLVVGFVLFSCIFTAAGLFVYKSYEAQLAERIRKSESDAREQSFQTTSLYDRRGNELFQLFKEGRRTKVTLAEIKAKSQVLIDATLATEDHTFYDNPGINVNAIARAGLQYFDLAEGDSGGSTITQQLVRNIAFDYKTRTERSFGRKFEEIVMALILTRDKSKDEILEMYLNQIFYGNYAYGIEAAAQTFFGKSVKDGLTLAEASLLAGLPQAPAELDPLNPDPKVQQAVLDRRKIVLDLMVERGKITRQQADDALKQTLSFGNPNVKLRYPHFTLYAESDLRDLLKGLGLPPSYITTAGLKVYTTIDGNFQDLAERVARDQIEKIRVPNNANNASVVIIKPTTGEVLAMVGSIDYNNAAIQGKVNVATSLQQPGSAIKPITYAAAMERGLEPASVFWDVPVTIKSPGAADYRPLNYDRGYRGPVRMRTALANSYNVPAVEALRRLSVPGFLSFSQRIQMNSLGTDASRYGLSLTLGGGEVTPLELTQAYAVLANRGTLISATSILCVIDSSDKVIYQYENGCENRGRRDASSINAATQGNVVLDPRIAFALTDILADNAARTPAMGANSPLRTDGLNTSVKTGTTDDFRDNWTVGYTRNVAVGVWVGNTDNKPMVRTTGLTGAAPIWNDIMRGIYSNQGMIDTLKVKGNLAPEDLTPPPGMSKRRVCDLASVKEPAGDCGSRSRSEWFFDTPLAVPDANGKLNAPGVVIAATPFPRNGPRITQIEPGVVRALAFPLNGSIIPVQAGQAAPLYCLVPNEIKDQVPGVIEQVFLTPPPFADQEAASRNWGQSAGIAVLPREACTVEMLSAPRQQPVAGVTAAIISPRPGEAVSRTVTVIGSVAFPPELGKFYKIELKGPQFPDWVTIDQTRTDLVVNGPLASFGAEGLQPGTYFIRITVIGQDSGILATSAEIPVRVGAG